MLNYKIKFVVLNANEEPVTEEFIVTVQQYMKVLGRVKKLKGVR